VFSVHIEHKEYFIVCSAQIVTATSFTKLEQICFPK
jgi:hypothetical protein